MEKGDTMREMIKAMEKMFLCFETEKNEIRKMVKAKEVIEIYDKLDRYLLSEEEDNFVYEMYSRTRNYLFDTILWEEPEFLPLF